MADNIQARAFAHGDIRIRAVHRDDHGQWLPLWHAYNVFYGRPWGQKDEPPVAPEVTAATWGRFFDDGRSEEHTSELQALMRISYAVFCLKKKSNIMQCLTGRRCVAYLVFIAHITLHLLFCVICQVLSLT